MASFEESYVGKIRKLVGSMKIIIPSVRAVITNEKKEILFVKRSDNAQWVLPAGSMELGESVNQALVREVQEETGLCVVSSKLLAIYSEDRFSYTNQFGDHNQIFCSVFIINEWSGVLETCTDETIDARFFDPSSLPDTPEIYRETVSDYLNYCGSVFIK